MKYTLCLISILLACALSLAGCMPVATPAETDPPVILPPRIETTPETGASTAPVREYSLSARDTDPAYDTVAGTAVFTDDGVTVTDTTQLPPR